jgi:hypothetical protein
MAAGNRSKRDSQKRCGVLCHAQPQTEDSDHAGAPNGLLEICIHNARVSRNYTKYAYRTGRK